jgi:glycosyltransferase involved in cell wall biosynthesis
MAAALTSVFLSFIIPAHDEATLIAATIGAVRASMPQGEANEIIVVDDASTDDTAGIAEAAGARVVRSSRRQIAAARNAGAAVASGSLLIFVDADTLISPALVSAAVAAIRDGAVGGGATLRFDEPLPRWARIWLPPFLWVYARFGLAAGCFFFCTRDAFQATGGFDETLFAAEEVALSLALRKIGRFVLLKETVLTSSRKLRTHSAREIFGDLVRAGLAGSGAARSRGRLGLWYGPRRKDRGIGPAE